MCRWCAIPPRAPSVNSERTPRYASRNSGRTPSAFLAARGHESSTIEPNANCDLNITVATKVGTPTKLPLRVRQSGLPCSGSFGGRLTPLMGLLAPAVPSPGPFPFSRSKGSHRLRCTCADGWLFARKGEGPTSFCFLALGLQAFSAEFTSRFKGHRLAGSLKLVPACCGRKASERGRAWPASRNDGCAVLASDADGAASISPDDTRLAQSMGIGRVQRRFVGTLKACVDNHEHNDGAQNEQPIGNLNACYRCFLVEPFHDFPPRIRVPHNTLRTELPHSQLTGTR
jgi:hypothetical protein